MYFHATQHSCKPLNQNRVVQNNSQRHFRLFLAPFGGGIGKINAPVNDFAGALISINTHLLNGWVRLRVAFFVG